MSYPAHLPPSVFGNPTTTVALRIISRPDLRSFSQALRLRPFILQRHMLGICITPFGPLTAQRLGLKQIPKAQSPRMEARGASQPAMRVSSAGDARSVVMVLSHAVNVSGIGIQTLAGIANLRRGSCHPGSACYTASPRCASVLTMNRNRIGCSTDFPRL